MSFFHLGSPLRAVRTLNNLKSSWLSREILFVLLFVLSLFILVLLTWKKPGSLRFQQILALTTGLFGILALWAMSRLYMLPTVPIWNSFSTPVAFFTTGLLLGSQWVIVCYSIYFSKRSSSASEEMRLHWFQKTRSGIEILALVLILTGLLNSVPILLHTAWRQAVRTNLSLFVARIALALIGGFILLLIVRRSKRQDNIQARQGLYVYTGFLVLFVAEFVGRFLFYGLYFRLGI
jgi:anaerobic dimethyl sulfoxide reductase subunit C (anchor subunit)